MLLPLNDKKILDVGCGTGSWLQTLIAWGATPANLHGIDLVPERIAEARVRCPSDVSLECGSAATLDQPDGHFDIVLQSTVFTSMLDPELRTAVATEMSRVLAPRGWILWYDFLMKNPSNPDVRAVTRQEIGRLFPEFTLVLQRITLAPPLARRVAPISWMACYLLSAMPFLCSHYIGLLRKPA